MDHEQMYSGLKAARSRMAQASGTNDEMLAMFDGITVCLAAVVEELADINDTLRDRANA